MLVLQLNRGGEKSTLAIRFSRQREKCEIVDILGLNQ